MIWLEFAVCAVLIFVSGSMLSKYADLLAEMTGMGRTWIGLVLLATVTSLPELATGVSAVTMADAPNIAAGDVLGSCVFNLMLIGVIDLFYRREPVLTRADQGHILSAGFGVLMIGLVTWGIVAGARGAGSTAGWIGVSTPLLIALYFMAVRLVFHFEQRRMAAYVKAEAETMKPKGLSASQVYARVALHAGIIVGAGIWLPFIGQEIAEITGWGTTFVGNLLIAASTSLPEIVTSYAAIRLAAPDLAVANVLGSNLFNMLVLAIDDLAYVKGPLLSHIAGAHLFSAVTALMMTGVAIIGLIYRTQKKSFAVLGWDSAALVLLYLFNAYVLFAFGQG